MPCRFKLTHEQRMIRSMVREFSRKVVSPPPLPRRDKSHEFPSRESPKQMGELGLMGMMIPRGIRRGRAPIRSATCSALSEIAYSCASTAVVMSVHNSIVCESILNRFGTEEQKTAVFKAPPHRGEK